jgi:glucan phosphoethanolaminetransferase (alkaline phosphatase superfamily)
MGLVIVNYFWGIVKDAQKLIESNKPFVFIYTSDHGEFTGEHRQYGHNKFDPVIYEVPFFITSNTNIPTTYKNINSHYHLAYYIFNLLGYNSKLNPMKNKHIINGTMISREDGFIEIKN